MTEVKLCVQVAEPFGGYSIDRMKRSAFVDEINNCLILLDDDDKFKSVIKEYLNKRIKEFDDRYN